MVWRSVDFQRFDHITRLQESLTNPTFFNGRATRTPTNDAVVKVNDDLLERLPGEVLTFHADNTGDIDNGSHEEMSREVMAIMNCGTLPLFSDSRLCPSDATSKSRSDSWSL